MSKKIKVTQIASVNNSPAIYEKHMRGLGLKRLGHSRELIDTPSIRGLIKKVSHLIKVEGN